MVLGLGDGAGGGEGGGVGGDERGGNCRSGMDGSKAIIRRYPGRGSICYSGGFLYWARRLSKKERGKTKKKGGGQEEGGDELKLRYGCLK